MAWVPAAWAALDALAAAGHLSMRRWHSELSLSTCSHSGLVYSLFYASHSQPWRQSLIIGPAPTKKDIINQGRQDIEQVLANPRNSRSSGLSALAASPAG